MTARQPGISDPFIRFHASGWIISLGLHGSAILLAGLFVAKIGLAPPSSSFQWDVTVVGSQPPATPAPVAPGAPPPVAAIIRPAQRNVPATALRPTPSQAALPTMPATTSSSPATVEHDTIEPALSPPQQAPAQLLERTPVVSSPPEPQETKKELRPSLHTTSAPVEALPDPRSLPQMANPPLADAPLTPEMSGSTSQSPSEPATSPAHTASLVPSNSTTQVLRKPDYGWLAGPLLQRIEALKQYPVTARLHRLEGRVIVRIVIQEDGHITSATIARSSGHDVLDQAALETIRQTSPLTLSQPLEKSSVTMQIPLGYYLNR
ncbi:MAG: energy transducer TonB [Nitrospirota bacterium]